jgi:hypothetical protein
MTASNARPPSCTSGFTLSKKAEDRISKWVSGSGIWPMLFLLSIGIGGSVKNSATELHRSGSLSIGIDESFLFCLKIDSFNDCDRLAGFSGENIEKSSPFQ